MGDSVAVGFVILGPGMRPTFKSKSALKSGEFTIGGFSNQRPVGCLSIPLWTRKGHT